MLGDLAFKLKRYLELVPDLLDEDEPENVMFALIYRDGIHDALKAGRRLTEDQARGLEEADEHLLAMREALVRRCPSVFLDRAPRDYWWWHLDKGPQVRDEALAAARRS